MRVVGLGADATRLRQGTTGATLRLLDPGSSARGLRIDGGTAAPALLLDDGAAVAGSVVAGRVRVRGGTAELSGVLVDSPSPALEAVLRDRQRAAVARARDACGGPGPPA